MNQFESIQISMMLFNMLDELCHELGYPNGAQDLQYEESSINIEILDIVYQRLEAQLKLCNEQIHYAVSQVGNQ